MTDREALIAEAARAVHAVECGCHYDGEHTNADIERRDRIARAVVAVFEQAHTPTDDEREALAVVVKQVSQKFGGPSMAEFAEAPPIRKHYATADAILTAGFRRTVQGERKTVVLTVPRQSGKTTLIAALRAAEEAERG